MGRRKTTGGQPSVKPEPVARGMAEHPQYRPYRADDQYGADTRKSREANDPLAELARLIGQDESHSLRKTAQSPLAREMHAQGDEQAAPDWLTRSSPRRGSGEDSAYGTYPQDRSERDPYADTRASRDWDDRAGLDAQDEYAAYNRQGAYGDDPYYGQDGHMPSHAEDFYDEAPHESRRRGGKIVILIVALAAIGAAGTFGYRAMMGTPGTATKTPVIMADAGPNKIAPASPASDNQQSKMIYDRVADRGQGERVVSREEQPVDLKDSTRAAPRVVLPGGVPVPPPPAWTPQPASPTPVTPSAAPPVGAVPAAASGTNEPKRVRTVTIRPDGTSGPESAVRMQTPQGAAASSTTSSATRAARPTPVTPEPPASSGSGPLAIAPQVQESVSRRIAALPPAQPEQQPSRAVAAPAVAGSYVVQVTSQKSESEAEASYRALQARYPAVLGSRQPIIRRADLGSRGVFYRAQVGPFTSSEQANEFCSSLRNAGGQCIVQRN